MQYGGEGTVAKGCLKNCTLFQLLLFSLSSLVKSSENGNGVTFRSGADVNMDIGVSGFGPESAIDRSMVMVSVATRDSLKVFIFTVFFFFKEKKYFYRE